MDDRTRRIGENEALFRVVNEQVRQLDERFGMSEGERQSFVCECGQNDCTARIELTLEEYAGVREEPEQFALVPGHENEDVEYVVRQTERYVVIRKREEDPADYVRRMA
jgi:hypothetical protein